MSGGSGTRLWPASRALYPKQFLKLTSELSLLQQTVERLKGFCSLDDIIVVANHEHRFLVAEQLEEIGIDNPTIILEPYRRNTAPAVALAAFSVKYSKKIVDDSALLVLPADHVVRDKAAFHSALTAATEFQIDKNLITFGVVPSHPSTEYGYIEKAELLDSGIFGVDRFVEKPQIDIAKKLVKDDKYLWNSGIFIFEPSVYLSELDSHRPDIYKVCQQAFLNAVKDLAFLKVDDNLFESCPSDSIDYAVMEKTQNAVVVSLDAGWSDVGTWQALHYESEPDHNGNVVIGDTMFESVTDSFLVSDKKLLVANDVSDILLVETDDSILHMR